MMSKLFSALFIISILFISFCGEAKQDLSANSLSKCKSGIPCIPESCSQLPTFIKIWEQQKNIYGNIKAEDYLIGNYKAQNFKGKAGYFVKIEGKYFRPEPAFALTCLKKAWHKNKKHKLKLKNISAFRSFKHQARIWNGKFSGKRSGYQSCPKKSAYDCAKMILRFSSMPGTSRHHWGTDIDLVDLTNTFFSKGQGLLFYNWMKKNAAKFGFCQPYLGSPKSRRKGFHEGYYQEKWHWSFTPLASRMLKDWNKRIKNKKAVGYMGTGGKIKVKGLRELRYSYVNNINPKCL